MTETTLTPLHQLPVLAARKPLAIGTKDILVAAGYAPELVRRYLQKVCGKSVYHLAISTSSKRYHPLTGEVVGEITNRDRAHALRVLRNRAAKAKRLREKSDPKPALPSAKPAPAKPETKTKEPAVTATPNGRTVLVLKKPSRKAVARDLCA